MKSCATCKTEKSEEDFYKNWNGSLSRHCRNCTCAHVRANRALKAEQYREYDRNRADRPDRVASRKQYQKSEAGKAAICLAKRRWAEKNRHRRLAHFAVSNALRLGILKKPECCIHCGSGQKIEAHHPSYSDPLCVSWLCEKCHKQLHKEHREREREKKKAAA